MIGKRMALAAVMMAGAAQAMAAGVPADCSKGPVPDQPLEVMIHAKPVTMTHIVARLNTQGMSVNGKNFVGHKLTLADDPGLFDRTYEIDFTLGALEGETLDGKSYVIYPTKEFGAQPQLGGDSGMSEIQGWQVEGPEIGANIRSSFNIASMTLVFGQTNGGKLPVQIQFCLAKDSVDRFTDAKVKTTYAIGRFEAVVE